MKYTFRAEYVRCSKEGCGTCPHGPYWYGYYKFKNKVHKRYFGKRDPRGGVPLHPWEEILCRETASDRLARIILNVPQRADMKFVRQQWLTIALQEHPDRGGDPQMFAYKQAAFSFLKEQPRK
jgi:hypothetical protein